MKPNEIKAMYRDAKREEARAHQLVEAIADLYEVVADMDALTNSEKWGEYLTYECYEHGGEKHLTFCLEKCVLKCKDYKFTQRHAPKLLAKVTQINQKYWDLLSKIKELKRA